MDLIELFKGLIIKQQSRPEYQKAKEELIKHETWSGVCSCGNNSITGKFVLNVIDNINMLDNNN